MNNKEITSKPRIRSVLLRNPTAGLTWSALTELSHFNRKNV
jgi:hypothetical protein